MRIVALRKESVDRNSMWMAQKPPFVVVALRKESVDRNLTLPLLLTEYPGSLSARRAWIEMCCVLRCCSFPAGRSPQGERG